MPYKDPEKQRAAALASYHRNSEAIKARRRRRAAAEGLGKSLGYKYAARNRAYVQELKTENPCVQCGQHYHYSAMDFDHVRGEKVANVATLADAGYSLDVVKEEIAKCDLVCANCHRYRTWQRRSVGP